MNTVEFITRIEQFNQSLTASIPSKNESKKFTDDMVNFLFPIRSERGLMELKLEQLKQSLNKVISSITSYSKQETQQAVEIFLSKLPVVFEKLVKDASFFTQSDPAAHSTEEVIIAYPGFYAIAIYRLAHELYLLNIPLLPRIISEYAHSNTGIDIHPGSDIGEYFFIDHGTGVVIGETTIIGNRVKIYQGVTLGALTVQKEKAHGQRHPTIEDNVVIYSGSTILGGNTRVGHDSIIGGNVWLTETVPPYSIVFHKSEIKIRDKSEMNSVLNFII